ncbi:MAG: SGNH/GDSL hydrolase family protein [Gammaproteobacteria bacterium]|nr:SGNH/GDSL hydrolase family protein [Gammaproteobacteria bacterium]
MKSNYQEEGISHNSRGFRGKREPTLMPKSFRAITVGDSFTYGLGVDDGETFSAYLSQYGDIEVINAGVNAYGVDQALLTWEKIGKNFTPNLVILGYFVGDFFRNALRIRELPKPYFIYDNEKQDFYLEGVPVPRIQSLEQARIFTPSNRLRIVDAFSYLQQKIRRKFGYLNTAKLQHKAKLSNYILNRFNDSVVQAGTRFLIVIIGHCYDGIPKYRWVENSILETCRVNDINCLNLAAEMRNEDYEAFYDSNCHWSKQGHNFAAKKIAASLRTKNPD